MQDYPAFCLYAVITLDKRTQILHHADTELEQTEINIALAYSSRIIYIDNMKKTTKELRYGKEN